MKRVFLHVPPRFCINRNYLFRERSCSSRRTRVEEPRMVHSKFSIIYALLDSNRCGIIFLQSLVTFNRVKCFGFKREKMNCAIL